MDDKTRRQIASDDPAIEEETAKSREELDKVPPPGTDPMHEGP